MATDLLPFRYEVTGFAVKMGLIAVVALLIAFSGIVLLNTAILAPVAALATLVRRSVTEKRFELRAATQPHDEVGALAADVNTLLERIGEREATLRRELMERSETQRRIEELAHFDPLTKLPNRHYFIRQLERTLLAAMQSGSAGAVLLVNLVLLPPGQRAPRSRRRRHAADAVRPARDGEAARRGHAVPAGRR